MECWYCGNYYESKNFVKACGLVVVSVILSTITLYAFADDLLEENSLELRREQLRKQYLASNVFRSLCGRSKRCITND